MKQKVIEDFDEYIKQLNIGYINDYSKILHEISFIQMYSSLDYIDPIYEYLMNN